MALGPGGFRLDPVHIRNARPASPNHSKATLLLSGARMAATDQKRPPSVIVKFSPAQVGSRIDAAIRQSKDFLVIKERSGQSGACQAMVPTCPGKKTGRNLWRRPMLMDNEMA